MICTVGTFQSKQKYMAEWILQSCRGALLLLFTLILPMSSAKRRHLKINCHMYRGIFARTRLCLLLAACETNSLMKKPSKQTVSCKNTHFGCQSTTRGKPGHKAFFDLKWSLHKYVRDALSAMSFWFTRLIKCQALSHKFGYCRWKPFQMLKCIRSPVLHSDLG